MDTGPYFGMVTEPIAANDTSGDLLLRLSESGARLLVATLDGIEDGTLEARPQPDDGVSLAPKFTAEDAHIRWREPAVVVDRLIRAATPAPGAWTTFRERRLKLGPVTAHRRVGDRARGTGPRQGRRPGGYGDGRGRARQRAARGQAADGRRRLGPRNPAAARRSPASYRAPDPCPTIPPGGSRSTSCAPSASAARTPTCCCRSCMREQPAASPRPRVRDRADLWRAARPGQP